MQIITKAMKQIARGEIVTLNQLIKQKFLSLDDYTIDLFNKILKTDITLRKLITVLEMPQPTREELIECILDGDIHLLKKHRYLCADLTEKNIKEIIKTYQSVTNFKWLPIEYRKDPEFRKWIYKLNRPILNKSFIRYMSLNEIQELFPGDNIARTLFRFPYDDELINNNIWTLSDKPLGTQHIVVVKITKSSEMGSEKWIKVESEIRTVRIIETILDIEIDTNTYLTKIVPKLKELL